MKPLAWNEEKNEWLKRIRHVSFEEAANEIKNKKYLDDIEHPNKEKYAHQRMWIVDIHGYIYLIPYVEDAEKYFLKTIIPSRKAVKTYRRKKKEVI